LPPRRPPPLVRAGVAPAAVSVFIVPGRSSQLIPFPDGGWPFKRDEEERGLAPTTTAASGQGWGGAGSSECLSIAITRFSS
jgi:hypothetical protein